MRISLAALNNYELKTAVPISRVSQTVNGVVYHEPFYDLDQWGNPVDLGFDVEPGDVAANDARLVEVFNISPSEFTETGIRIPVKGRAEAFSFDERPYLRRIYNTHSKKVLLMAGRQVEKSTLLGNIVLSYSCLNNYYRTLYVTPSAEQSKVFSRDRIHDIIQVSPTVKAYTNTNLTNAVFHKKFINYSQVIIRAAYLNADRCRGIPADTICLDELQDFIVDNIPVIEECASHSNFKIFRYSGTPKSLDNTIEHYWSQFSTQCEWAVPCHRHGTPKNKSSWFWNILREANIGKEGVVCSKCKKPIDVNDPYAQWVSFNPQTEHNQDRVTFEGYRLPQLMVPWIAKCPKGWKSIIEKQESYSRQKFNNEVMGLSYDSGVRPITKSQLKKCCLSDVKLSDFEFLRSSVSKESVFGGIDWGCHDDQTRILTQEGWKYFEDLTDDDLVAQWDPESREMTFTKPLVRTKRQWDEPLYHFETKGGLDLAVTSTHRLRVSTKGKKDWFTERAEETSERAASVKFVGHINWSGEEVATFTLPGLPKSPGYKGSEDKTFTMDKWLEFLGYLVTEGGLCKNKKGRPTCLKMSQRVSANEETAEKIRLCLIDNNINCSEFHNDETSDLNWTIHGKQYWHWFRHNIGDRVDRLRLPRWIFSLSKRQLRIIFDAMVAGDGSIDPRENCSSGSFSSTSIGLCEDFQEICIRLGLRCYVSLHKKAEGNRKTRYRAGWSRGRDYSFNDTKKNIKRIPYNGPVFCCKVPDGYIVTERNGKVAYQGNTGEGSYTVLSLGTYLADSKFTVFYTHRFTGEDLEPVIQLDKICQILTQFNVRITGCDYGGGFDKNAHLIRQFGPNKIVKYQYTANMSRGKVVWNDSLLRFLVHRTEVMSDIFSAFLRQEILLPSWDQFADPYGSDILNIFSEKNEIINMIQYKHSPGKTDDTFHSILYCFLASMLVRPRPDIIAPRKDG